MLSPALKSFHDAVYVLTIPKAEDRQENVLAELGEGNYEFVYGADKRDGSFEQFVSDGTYDEDIARCTDRRNKAMTLGHICCSLGHRMIYEKFLDSGAERALIFEDDVVTLAVDEQVIAEMVANIPEDADLIYWGWEGGGHRPKWGGAKLAAYHMQHALGLLRYNHTMIRNLYSRPYDDHFDIAGKHFLAHSYTVNRKAAEALIKWNTPIKLNADNALMYAVMNGDVRGYLARTQLFGQRSADKNDPMATLTA